MYLQVTSKLHIFGICLIRQRYEHRDTLKYIEIENITFSPFQIL